jgi:hypothetical protein
VAVRSHDDKIAGFRLCGFDDRSVGLLMLELEQLACNAYCSRCVGDSAKNILGMPPACMLCTEPACPRSAVSCMPVYRLKPDSHSQNFTGRGSAMNRSTRNTPSAIRSPRRHEPGMRRDDDPERLGGLTVYHQVELGRLLDRQVGRLGALENAIDIRGGTAVLVNRAKL